VPDRMGRRAGSHPRERAHLSGRNPADVSVPNPAHREATLLMIGVALMWGFNISIMKAAVSEVTPLAFNTLRFPLGVAALAILLWRREPSSWPQGKEWGEIFLLGIAAHPVYQLCFLYGLHLTSASHTAVLVSMTPVWVAFADRVFGHERLPRAAWIGIFLSLAGVAVLVLARAPTGKEASWLGDVLVIASSMLWTFYVIRSRPLLRRRSALWVTSWALFAGTPFLIAMGIPHVLQIDWTQVTYRLWVGVVFAGFLSLAVAYWWWAAAVARQGAARTAVFSNLIPVIALTFAWIALGERLGALSWLGAGLACLGVWMAAAARSRKWILPNE